MPEVRTVLGPIAPTALGKTMMHEHLLIDTESIWERHSIDGQLNDEGLIADELSAFKAAGGSAIAEMSVPGLARNPAGLARISTTTGVHVVMGCGWYRQPWYPAEIDLRTTNYLADSLSREIEDGEAETGIRPGIIGEIGAHKRHVSAQEERVMRACARAARRTGLAISTHAMLSR